MMKKEKAKRNIMMMQMFNYDRTNRYSEQMGKLISIILIILVVCMISYIFLH